MSKQTAKNLSLFNIINKSTTVDEVINNLKLSKSIIESYYKMKEMTSDEKYLFTTQVENMAVTKIEQLSLTDKSCNIFLDKEVDSDVTQIQGYPRVGFSSAIEYTNYLIFMLFNTYNGYGALLIDDVTSLETDVKYYTRLMMGEFLRAIEDDEFDSFDISKCCEEGKEAYFIMTTEQYDTDYEHSVSIPDVIELPLNFATYTAELVYLNYLFKLRELSVSNGYDNINQCCKAFCMSSKVQDFVKQTRIEIDELTNVNWSTEDSIDKFWC